MTGVVIEICKNTPVVPLESRWLIPVYIYKCIYIYIYYIYLFIPVPLIRVVPPDVAGSV
jgi:hypothetical protein